MATQSAVIAVLPFRRSIQRAVPDMRLGDVHVQSRQPVDHRVPGEA